MMQTAKPWHRYDLAICAGVLLWLTSFRRSLRQPEMRSILVVVTNVFVHQTFQVAFIDNDHMVEQVSAGAADPTLGDTVLPWTSEAGSLGLNVEALHCFDYFATEVCTTIKDQVSRGRVEGKCLAQLLNDPRAGWIFGRLAVENPPPVMRNDEEAVQHAEGKCWHSEEVHRNDRLPMIPEKSRPSLCRLRTSRRFPHPAQHRSFGNIDAKHLRLGMNARRTPG